MVGERTTWARPPWEAARLVPITCGQCNQPRRAGRDGETCSAIHTARTGAGGAPLPNSSRRLLQGNLPPETGSSEMKSMAFRVRVVYQSVPGRAALALAALMLCLLWAYWTTLATMAERWATDAQYSHGFLVPV